MSDLKYWNIWDVHMAGSDNLKKGDFCVFFAGIFKALRKNDPNKKQNACLAGMTSIASESSPGFPGIFSISTNKHFSDLTMHLSDLTIRGVPLD